MTDDEDSDFPACTEPECKRRCGSNSHKHDGLPICKKCAVKLANGRCAWCGEAFDPEFGGYDAYASREGLAYCITCWHDEGYNLPMRPRAGDPQ